MKYPRGSPSYLSPLVWIAKTERRLRDIGLLSSQVHARLNLPPSRCHAWMTRRFHHTYMTESWEHAGLEWNFAELVPRSWPVAHTHTHTHSAHSLLICLCCSWKETTAFLIVTSKCKVAHKKRNRRLKYYLEI